MIVDFHSHTYESDGTLSPQALVDFMAERHVEIFSISDHDTLSAYGQFTLPPGMRVVVGIEINTTYRENEVHVLGYNVAPDAPALTEMIEHNCSERLKRVERMVSQLRRAGYSITLDAVLREGDSAKALGRPHVGKALVRSGAVPDIDYAFRHLLRSGKPGYVPSMHVTPHEAIDAIAACGGVSVLAHPGRLKDRVIIDELAAAGLNGLEVFYPRHDADDVRIFSAKAKERGLVRTAGSDFHDLRYHSGGVGMEVDAADIEPFLDHIKGPVS